MRIWQIVVSLAARGVGERKVVYKIMLCWLLIIILFLYSLISNVSLSTFDCDYIHPHLRKIKRTSIGSPIRGAVAIYYGVHRRTK